MKSGIRKAGLVALVGVVLGVGVYGCKSASLEEKLYKQTKIAFMSDRDANFEIVEGMRIPDNYEIYVMNAVGSEQRNLTNYLGIDMSPSWSPDGKKIVFASIRDEVYDIYVMNADGSEQKNLTNNPAEYSHPSWSPDGKKIVYATTGEIYVMNADGSEQVNLTNNPTWDSSPSWSPDGKRITYISNRDRRDGNDNIYVMNADGSGQRNLTNNPAFYFSPSWSPDGKKIVFALGDNGREDTMKIFEGTIKDSESLNINLYAINADIYVMNADGSERTRLTNNLGYDMFPSWSPFLVSENNEKK